MLRDAGFPVKELKLFGSARSAGTKVQTKWGEITIEDFSVEEARKMDVRSIYAYVSTASIIIIIIIWMCE